MKVIFLDIDGVLNSLAGCHAETPVGEDIDPDDYHGRIPKADNGFIGIDPVPVQLFNRLIKESGAKLVLSSTWRLDRWADKGRRDGIQHTLFHMRGSGFDPDVRFIGRTPELWGEIPGSLTGEKYERGHEIQKWMDDWRGETIEKFVILDDNDDMAHLKDHLVLTSWERGLEEVHVERALEMLHG